MVGKLGTVLQASIAISGSIGGPLFALFCLGMFFPFTNAKGAVLGLISGVMFSLSIAVGTLAYPKPSIQKPIGVEGCSAEIYEHYGRQNATEYILPWDYHPE